MVKYCKRCYEENPDSASKCSNCNTEFEIDYSIENRKSRQPVHHKSIRDHESRAVKIFTFILVIFITFIGFLIYFGLSGQFGFAGINCQINEDFYFEGNYLNTSEGWSFTMTKVKDYTLEGIVIALKTYDKSDFPYDPVNIFSPIDLAIGIEDIMENPEKYDYSITSFNNRVCNWYLNYDDNLVYQYFKSHTGNNHIIPHNQEVLNELSNVSVNDCVDITGSLVNLYGVRGGQNYHWNTDTGIGNYACEIILVDSITIIN